MSIERRQFGRRESSFRGHIAVSGRMPIGCTIRNVSDRGALIECDEDFTAGPSVRLTVDSLATDVWCEARHQTNRTIGVRFVNNSAAEALIQHTMPGATAAANRVEAAVRPVVAAQPASNRELRLAMFGQKKPQAPAA